MVEAPTGAARRLEQRKVSPDVPLSPETTKVCPRRSQPVTARPEFLRNPRIAGTLGSGLALS